MFGLRTRAPNCPCRWWARRAAGDSPVLGVPSAATDWKVCAYRTINFVIDFVNQSRYSVLKANERERRGGIGRRRHPIDLDLVERKLEIQRVNSFRPFEYFECSLEYQPEDWFTVALTDAHEMGLSKGVRRKQQLVELLKEKYPQHNWDKMFILKGRFGQQRRLEQAVTSLFPVLWPFFNLINLRATN
jgi:hypothetical protein